MHDAIFSPFNLRLGSSCLALCKHGLIYSFFYCFQLDWSGGPEETWDHRLR